MTLHMLLVCYFSPFSLQLHLAARLSATRCPHCLFLQCGQRDAWRAWPWCYDPGPFTSSVPNQHLCCMLANVRSSNVNALNNSGPSLVNPSLVPWWLPCSVCSMAIHASRALAQSPLKQFLCSNSVARTFPYGYAIVGGVLCTVLKGRHETFIIEKYACMMVRKKLFTCLLHFGSLHT